VTKLAPRKEKYRDFEHFFAVFSFGVRFATQFAFPRGGTRALVLAETEAEIEVDVAEASY